MKIDWNKVWKDFDKWFFSNAGVLWEDQAKKIQSLVEAQLKPKRKQK